MTKEEIKEKFPLGSKVKLNVGGPIMAVSNHELSGDVQCKWFVGKKLETGRFAPETLEIVEEDKANAEPKS